MKDSSIHLPNVSCRETHTLLSAWCKIIEAVCLPSHSLGKFWPAFTVLPFPHSLSSLSHTFPAFPILLFKHYCELGFGFDSSPVDDDRCLSDTLPVVGLYYAIKKRYNNCLLSKTTSSSSDCDNTPSPFGSPHSSVFTTGLLRLKFDFVQGLLRLKISGFVQ
ncbi:hypothetical protein Fmac_018371 [Flemingia macrophylla]|uniref:Uncharacterized protein n=1 Tax=Flemingia macrophylla TaxID=520843 RepID=A0ABD1M4U2_9FABA